jgi:cysteine-rich repeat protein
MLVLMRSRFAGARGARPGEPRELSLLDALLVTAMLVGASASSCSCNGNPSGTADCSPTCAADHACVDRACLQLCNSTDECLDAGLQCVNGLCQSGGQAFCGNGTKESGEECDNGGANSDVTPDACRRNCKLPECKDGVVDAGEQCDEGSANSDVLADACRVNCLRAHCGDGVRDTGEACDDGALNSNTLADACRLDCQLPKCGDGVLDTSEACDDGSLNSNTLADACRLDCDLPSCGDTVKDAGEECDNGLANSNTAADACRLSCGLAGCGDGVRDSGEDCDDGNAVDDGNGCSTICKRQGSCGDAVVQSYFEQCDDDNQTSFDGCSATCQYLIWSAATGATIARGASLSLWSYGTAPTTWRMGVGTTNGRVVVFDPMTGAQTWSYAGPNEPISAPLAAWQDNTATLPVFAIWNDGTVAGLAKDGTTLPLWTANLATRADGAGLALWNNTTAVAAENTGRLRTVSAGVVAGLGTYPDGYLINNMSCTACTPTLPLDETGVILPIGGAIYYWDMYEDMGTGDFCPPFTLALNVTESVVKNQLSYMHNDVTDDLGGVDDRAYAATTGGRILGGHRGGSMACGSRTLALDWAAALPTVATAPPAAARVGTARVVFVGGEDGKLYRIEDPPGTDPATWAYDSGSAIVGTPAVGADAGGAMSVIVVGNVAGEIHAVAPNGNLLWKYALPSPPTGSPLIWHNAVYVATEDGTIYALERGSQEAPIGWWSRDGGGVTSWSSSSMCGAGGTHPVVGLLLVLWLWGRARRAGARR